MNMLVKLFVKDYENINDEKVRGRYGSLSSITGIVANLMLFALKFSLGTICGCISVISDAFNNLSDAGSCVITLFGYKMASKPADKDHPFGHGRMEYLLSLIVACIIIVLGFELLRTSAGKIFNPDEIKFSWVVAIALILSIGVKLWLSFFNTRLGKKINSPVMLATGKDSLNDVFATLATLVALFASLFTSAPIDGIMGCVVSIVIMFAGVGIVKDTVDELIGKPADKELVESIRDIMMSETMIIGIHDMLIHTYGPGVTFGSVHAEVSADCDILEAHDIIDELEKKVYDTKGVVLTVHMDPVEVGNPEVDRLREKINVILENMKMDLSFHDFRVVFGNTHTNLIFDVVVPFDCEFDCTKIKSVIDEELKKEPVTYFTVINFDNEYIEK